MLTPVEIQSKSFKSGGLGYDKKDVDSYMREVLKNYEELYRSNMEQKDKISVLNEGIQYYKTIEKTLQRALVLAEKTAEETRRTAEQDAKRIEKEAMAKAKIMVADAKNELEMLHQQTVSLLQQYEKYKAQFKCLAAAQIDLLETDAFQINISRLDAFISASSSEQQAMTSTSIKVPKFVNSEHKDSIEEAAPGLEEIKQTINNDNEKSYESHYDDYDFSDFEIEGQEEFDFLDLNDNEE